MISSLSGTLVESLPTRILVEVGGVGYELWIPLSSYNKLPVPPSPVRIWTHLVVREDAHTLYGFSTEPERDLFRMLVQYVTGVGPKVALSILSGMSVEGFKQSVTQGDVVGLSKIKGLGKKTAERIIVDLRDRIGAVSGVFPMGTHQPLTDGNRQLQDAVLALISLGYKQTEAYESVKAAREQLGEDAGVEELVRTALRG